MLKPEDFIVMPIPASQYASVCALLGGAAILAAGAGASAGNVGASPATAPSSGGAETLAPESQASAGTGETAPTGASPSDGEIDAHGHPWSAELHASTKGKTKDGLWRMKVGVSRPDPLPGFPTADTGTSDTGTGAQAGASATTGTAESPAGEDDEFAAFRAAAATSDAADAAAVASVQPRKLSDADLGALCNQAAVKLGDPSPVKEIIAQYVPQGEVAHSRNIPEDKREEFVKAVEAKAGIEFAG